MLNFGNREFRNIQEQVAKNQYDIATLTQLITTTGITMKGEVETLPSDAAVGDAYVVEEILYLYTENGWVRLSGPEGPIGIQGPAGPQGIRGNRVTYGNTAPSGAIEGDMWITSDGLLKYYSEVYKSWQTYMSIKGPQGPQGNRGPQGYQGIQGPAGPAGADGQPAPVVEIQGELESITELPNAAATVENGGRNYAYLIPIDGANHIYIITPAADSFAWSDGGVFALDDIQVPNETALNQIATTRVAHEGSTWSKLYLKKYDGTEAAVSFPRINGVQIIGSTTEKKINYIQNQSQGSKAIVSVDYYDATYKANNHNFKDANGTDIGKIDSSGFYYNGQKLATEAYVQQQGGSGNSASAYDIVLDGGVEIDFDLTQWPDSKTDTTKTLTGSEMVRFYNSVLNINALEDLLNSMFTNLPTRASEYYGYCNDSISTEDGEHSQSGIVNYHPKINVWNQVYTFADGATYDPYNYPWYFTTYYVTMNLSPISTDAKYALINIKYVQPEEKYFELAIKLYGIDFEEDSDGHEVMYFSLDKIEYSIYGLSDWPHPTNYLYYNSHPTNYVNLAVRNT